MSAWFQSKPGLWRAAWSHLSDGVPLVSLATIGPNGPEQRNVVVREADAEAKTVAFYTDKATPKVKEIQSDNRISVVFWSDASQLQIRLIGTAEIFDGDDVAELWDSLPDHNRGNYRVTPVPGTQISTSNAYERNAEADRLAKIVIQATKLDIVHLSPDYHRRAFFNADNDWLGDWVAP